MPAPQEAEPGKGGFRPVDPDMRTPFASPGLPEPTSADAHICTWYEWGERAAWLEFGCGLDRAVAEQRVTAEWLRSVRRQAEDKNAGS